VSEQSNLSRAQLHAMCDWLLPIARDAGDAIMAVYQTAQAHPQGRASALVHHKTDQSPLTQADVAAHNTIAAGLAKHAPEIVLISEESYHPEQMVQAVKQGKRFWLVDPLDGTKEFLSGTGEFTVNIALIERGVSVLGVVYQPTTDELFWGGAQIGAWHQAAAADRAVAQPMTVAANDVPPWRVLASRNHLGPQTKELIKRMGHTTLLQAGSSLKFCRIAGIRPPHRLYLRVRAVMSWPSVVSLYGMAKLTLSIRISWHRPCRMTGSNSGGCN